YGIGLKAYDLMSFGPGSRIGRSSHLSRRETMEALPTLKAERLKGGTRYIDGQFDDARLAITLARTAADLGATVINYMPVVRLVKKNGRVCGIIARESETDREYELQARLVINATGVFTDFIRRLDEPAAAEVISPSQGAHIVLPRRFLPGEAALMVPKTDDKRVLFAIPWHDRVLVGTTDTAVKEILPDPASTTSEIEFLLGHAGRYLTVAPQPSDILSTFAGLRPLVKPGGRASPRASALVPRDHSILISASGLVSVTGGKWTTYRKMAEETIDCALTIGGLPQRPCRTEELPLHGRVEQAEGSLPAHGSDASEIRALAEQVPDWNKPLHPDLPYIAAEVVWAARMEMARTVEDFLARRTRALFLDARASLAAAPMVASLLGQELGRNTGWVQEQNAQYRQLVRKYLPLS
ncbi:MAG TPA: glycerol-3-phosphate dehydrogenase/oxidase, partial [Verrucomicrobiae bacterium]|nr:glycerol-3-phosphate dehydrogenase/oxidase [Verrucomicrobiae bacterium]